jgi:hypothetical protein
MICGGALDGACRSQLCMRLFDASENGRVPAMRELIAVPRRIGGNHPCLRPRPETPRSDHSASVGRREGALARRARGLRHGE